MAATPTAENRLSAGQVIAFARNIDLVGQQRKSRLISHVDADMAFSEPGDRFTDELMGLSDPQDKLTDIEPTPGGKVKQTRRVQFFKTFDDGNWVGNRDQAEKLVNIKNPTVTAMGFGRERRRDRTILGVPGKKGGLFGDAYETDNDGDIVSVGFPAGQIVPFNYNLLWKGKADGSAAPTAPTVLSPQKLRRTKIILDKSEWMGMTGDLPVIAVEEEDLQNFLTSEENSNKDYTNNNLTNLQKLVDGEIDVLKGYRFVKVSSGSLPLVPGQSNRYYAPVWFPMAIKYKERPLKETRVTERADMSYNWHAYYQAQDAVMRREDNAVAWIEIER